MMGSDNIIFIPSRPSAGATRKGDTAMAEKRFTHQIVLLEEQEYAAAIDTIAEQYGVSRAELCRRALRLGLPLARREYEDAAREDQARLAILNNPNAEKGL